MRQINLTVDKRIVTSGSLLAGALLYALMGGLLLLRQQLLYSAFRPLATVALALLGMLGLLSFLFGSKRQVRQLRQLVTALISLAGAWVAWNQPRRLLVLLPLALGLNALASGMLQLVTCYLQRRNEEWMSNTTIISGVLSILFGVLLLASPMLYINTAVNLAAFYCLTAALTQFSDFWEERRPIGAEEPPRRKRRVRFSVPGFLTALVPKRQQERVERSLKRRQAQELPPDQDDDIPDFEIFIHATERGLGSIGHVDICFENIVRTYGPYDKESHRLMGLICKGVLAVVQGRERYLAFCTGHSQKTIFCYGIRLTEAQRLRVRGAIAELMQEVVIWNSPHRRDLHGKHDDYASLLQIHLDAQLYHFIRGGFQTYFMGGANCAVLADRIVGALGTDIPSATGLLTPGAYFNYLDREYRRQNSIIVSKRVYRPSDDYAGAR